MEKTWEHQEEMGVEDIGRKLRDEQQEQWKKLDGDGMPLSTVTNGYTNNIDKIMVELGNAFEEIVHGKKELENRNYKSYGDVKLEVEEKKSEMNVYYDKEEGIWKCRNCCWTYQNGRSWTEHIEHPKQYLHMHVNPKTVNRQESCFYCELKGLKFTCGFVATESNGVLSSASLKSPGDDGLVVTVKNFLSETTNIKRQPFKENAGNKYCSEITNACDNQEIDEISYSVTQLSGKTQLYTEDVIHKTQKQGVNIEVYSIKESLTPENSHLDQKTNDTNYDSGASLSVIIETKANTYFEEHSQAAKDTMTISIKDHVLFSEKHVEITEELNETTRKAGAGPDTYIMVGELAEPKATQAPQGITSPHIERVEYERFQGIEIVKSIVYGGFPELIASLGIVSSAVGADTATLKILALGLANLIGGLFIIGHNLWDLKSDQHSYISYQTTESNSIELTTQQDRYEEILGQRKNFWGHATIALLSYLVFGMVPPVIYAFSFRESDNKDYKLIAVAAASLVCILILSTGKTYIQRPPKAYLKTILFYTTMVFMTSGVSYAFGNIFKKLFESLRWLSYSPHFSLPVLETPSSALTALASF